MDVLVMPQVLPPKLFRTGAWLAQTLTTDLLPSGSRVLDMGCGSGIVSLTVAGAGCRSVAVDINPAAVACTTVNADRCRLSEHIDARQGDLFEPLGDEKFDLIIFNPPFLTGTASTVFEQALYGGDTIARFFNGAQQHLEKDGAVLLLLSTLADTASILSTACRNGFSVDLIAEKHYINESLMLYRLKPT